MAKVTTILPSRIEFSSKPIASAVKKKVAAYARVSTDHEEQQSSYEAQNDYFTRLIRERADWEFVGMYADEGITATNTKNRDGFKRMIKDALDGKIELILTKSVSRFARNTVDSLTTIRELKEKGVGVYFEKENINTLDAKGEILSSDLIQTHYYEHRLKSPEIRHFARVACFFMLLTIAGCRQDRPERQCSGCGGSPFNDTNV